MGDNFKKFKSKILTEVLIKSLIVGFSIGAAATGTVLLICKSQGVSLDVYWYVLMGLGLFAAIACAVFFAARPSDIRIAKRLDEELGLNEKVQTMVSFADDDGFVVQVQRQDTQERLGRIPLKKVRFRALWAFVLIPVLACTIFATSIALPAAAVNPPPVGPTEPPYEVDEWEIAAIRTLIMEVRDSKLEDEVKTVYVAELDDLIGALEAADTASKMRAAVTRSVNATLATVDRYNSNVEIYEILKDSDDPSVVLLAKAIKKLTADACAAALEIMQEQLKTSDDVMYAAGVLHAQFGFLLESEQSELTDDGLYVELTALSRNLSGCSFPSDVSQEFKLPIPAVKMFVQKQADVKDMGDHIVVTLCRVFEIDNPAEDEDDEDEENSDNEEEDGSGGIGDGDLILGGKDGFFDPDTGYVKYPEVIHDYYAVILERMKKGEISDEQWGAYLNAYFNLLYGAQDSSDSAN